MSDRLHELQRQRVLAQEQLAFLGREIAAEIARTGSPIPVVRSGSPSSADMAATARRATNTLESALPADAEGILAQYAKEPASIKSDVKKGCFLYVFLAAITLAAAVIALYLYTRNK